MVKGILLGLLGSAAGQAIEISPDSLPPVMLEIMSMMQGLTQQHRPQIAPRNPCDEDMRRTNCDCARCLTESVATAGPLSPNCMRLLGPRDMPVFMLEPSPSPAPMFFADAEIDVSFEDDAGHEFAAEIITSRGGAPPELLRMIDALMPVGMRETIRQRPIEEPEPSHPCQSEIMHCPQNDVTACLVANYALLSPRCQCFVHRFVPTEQLQAISKPAPPPVVRVIGDGSVTSGSPLQYAIVLETDHPHRPHALACMLFAPLMLFATILLVRRCCIRCRAAPQFVAVVPPESATTIKAIEPLVWDPKIVKVPV